MNTNNNLTIEHIKWGEIRVNGQIYKDIKIWNNKCKTWNWDENDTHHKPGIQIADIVEFINDVDYVILSRGYKNVLETQPQVIKYLEYKKKNFKILTTDEAVIEYNRLVNLGYKVGGLIHSTC